MKLACAVKILPHPNPSNPYPTGRGAGVREKTGVYLQPRELSILRFPVAISDRLHMHNVRFHAV